jgi:hypothetical protein
MKNWMLGISIFAFCYFCIEQISWPYSARARLDINRIIPSSNSLAGITELDMDHVYRVLPIDVSEKLGSDEVLKEAWQSLGFTVESADNIRNKVHTRLVTGSTAIEIIGYGKSSKQAVDLVSSVLSTYNRQEKNRVTKLTQALLTKLRQQIAELLQEYQSTSQEALLLSENFSPAAEETSLNSDERLQRKELQHQRQSKLIQQEEIRNQKTGIEHQKRDAKTRQESSSEVLADAESQIAFQARKVVDELQIREHSEGIQAKTSRDARNAVIASSEALAVLDGHDQAEAPESNSAKRARLQEQVKGEKDTQRLKEQSSLTLRRSIVPGQIDVISRRIHELEAYEAGISDPLVLIDAPHADDLLRKNQKKIAIGIAAAGSILITLSILAIEAAHKRSSVIE